MDIQKFIESHRDDINFQSFKKVYDAALKSLSINNLSKLTELFYKCGIDPLQYMAEVPSFYAYGSTLKDVKIPNNVTSIGNYAFSYCKGLTNITIPDSINSIGISAFSGCSDLISVIIPGSVTSISELTFGGCYKLMRATIESGVTFVGEKAFSGCFGLASVIIPSSVVSIGPEAFYNCRSLTAIDYVGNKEQWDLIKKRSGWKNNSLIQVIHCIDGDINL